MVFLVNFLAWESSFTVDNPFGIWVRFGKNKAFRAFSFLFPSTFSFFQERKWTKQRLLLPSKCSFPYFQDILKNGFQ